MFNQDGLRKATKEDMMQKAEYCLVEKYPPSGQFRHFTTTIFSYHFFDKNGDEIGYRLHFNDYYAEFKTPRKWNRSLKNNLDLYWEKNLGYISP